MSKPSSSFAPNSNQDLQQFTAGRHRYTSRAMAAALLWGTLLLAASTLLFSPSPVGAQDSSSDVSVTGYSNRGYDGAAFVPPDLSGPWPSSTQLSDQARITVLTMDEGKDIYLAFGHSAFRVQDPARDLDLVFNYGSFDLQNPLFVPNFVRGYLLYELVVQDFRAYLAYDRRTQNREWSEQELLLPLTDKQRLFDFLNFNAQPQNSRYIYDFIKDNCSTRIRDVLQLVFGNRVQFDLSPERDTGKSYRQLLDEYVNDRPGWQYSFYLVLGMASDRASGAWISAWLPDYLQDMIAHTSFKTEDGIRPLAPEIRKIYTPVPANDYGEPWANPLFFLLPMVGLALFFSIRKTLVWLKSKPGVSVKSLGIARLFDFLLFLMMGLTGLVVFYLEFFSVHTAVKGNLNLIWLFPTHLLAAFLLFKRKPLRITHWYFALFGGIFVLQVLLLPLWPQQLSLALVCTLVLAATRCYDLLLRGGFFDKLKAKRRKA